MNRTIRLSVIVTAIICVVAIHAWKGRDAIPEPDNPKPKEEFTNSIGMQFKLIPPGEFMMGSSESPEVLAKHFGWPKRWFARGPEYFMDEHPQHRVKITKQYYLGIHEVTQGQWEELMGTTPWQDREFARTNKGGQRYVKVNTTHPASYVSWRHAVEFCIKLSEKEGLRPCYSSKSTEDGGIHYWEFRVLPDGTGYRLPTEAEWEYACRAGTQTRYYFGDDESQLDEYAWYDKNASKSFFWSGDNYPRPVGQKKPNAFGLYDMHGNVFEWCADWQSSNGVYRKSDKTDPKGPRSGSYRMIRGGAWCNDAGFCRSAERSSEYPGQREYYLGFRVALGIADE